MKFTRFARQSVAGLVLMSALTTVLAVTPATALSSRQKLTAPVGASPLAVGLRGALAQQAASKYLTAVQPGVDGSNPPAPADVSPENDRGQTSDVPPFDRPAETEVPAAPYTGPTGYIDGESVVVDGTPTSLTYKNPDGTNTTKFFPEAVVFQDPVTGEWKQYDSTPTLNADGRVEPTASDLDVSLATTGADPALAAIDDGDVSVSFSLEDAAQVDAALLEGGLRYPEVLPGVTLEERTTPSGVKEDLVLASVPDSAPTYRFRLNLTGLTPSQATDGSIEFTDAAGVVRFTVPKGVAWDSNEAVLEEQRRVPVQTSLVNEGGVWFVNLVPDWQWLTDPARVFPVTVDPTFDTKTGTTAANKKDAYIVSGVPYGAYNGTSGTYSQYSSMAGTYADKVGWTMAGGVWQEYESYFYAQVSVPATPTRHIVSAYLKGFANLMFEYNPSTGVGQTPPSQQADFELQRVTSTWYVAPNGDYSTQPNALYWLQRPTSTDPQPQVVAAGQWFSADILDWVNLWDTGAAPNHGIRLRGLGQSTIGSGHAWFQIGSLESSTSTPYIEVTYFHDPTLVSPNNAVSEHKKDSDLVTFTWSDTDAVANADLNYRVQVCTDAAFTQNCVHGDSWLGSTATSQTIPAYMLNQNTTLYWRVEKKRASVGSASGEVFSSYRTYTLNNQQPPAPTIPANAGTSNSLTVPPVTDPNAGDHVYYYFEVCSQPNRTGDCLNSGWITPNTFTTSLAWGSTYYWTVFTSDGLPSSTVGYAELEVIAATPDNAATDWVLGNYPNGAPSGVVDLSSGNLYFTTIDQTVSTPATNISMARSYNSLDNRVSAFGRGWSFPLDMQIVLDASANAKVTMPDGRVEFHGKNANGTYAAAFGYQNKLVRTTTPNEFKLTDPSKTVYKFGPKSGSTTTYELTGITTSDGLQTNIVWWNSTLVSLYDVTTTRYLTLNLTTPVGATRWHVASMLTPPLAANGGVAATWTYTYNGDDLTSACSPDVDPSAAVKTLCTTYTYNANHDMIREETPQLKNGMTASKKTVFDVTYAADGKVATQTSGVGGTWVYDYTLNANTTIPNPSGGTVTPKYHAQVTSPMGVIHHYYFDNARRLIYERDGGTGTGAPGDPIVYGESWIEYNSFGFMTKETERVGKPGDTSEFSTTAYVVNASGQTVSKTDPNGAVWLWEYNNSGQVKKETTPGGAITTYTYDADENGTAGAGMHTLTKTMNAPSADHGAATLTYTYSGATTPAFAGLTAEHPPKGLMTKTVDPRGGVTTYEYDKKGDLRRVTNPVGLMTQYTYDELGRKIQTMVNYSGSVSGTWHVTESDIYDNAGRLIQIDGEPVTNPVTNEVHRTRTSNTYDDAGYLISVTISDIGGSAHPDASRTTTYHLDNGFRKDIVTDAEGHAVTTEYDLAGNVTAVTDANGNRSEFAYDNRGLQTRTTLKNFDDDPLNPSNPPRDVVTSRTTYDVAQRIVSKTDALGHIQVTTYDQWGMGWPVRVDLYHDQVARNAGTITQVLSTTAFDSSGRPTTNSSAGVVSGGTVTQLQTVNTTYDLWGRAKTITTNDGTVTTVKTNTYDASGNIVSVKVQGGALTGQTNTTYDLMNNPTTVTQLSATGNLITAFEFDRRGLRIGNVDPRGNGNLASPYKVVMTYDALGRLSTTTRPAAPMSTVDRDTTTVTTTTATSTTTIGYDSYGDGIKSVDQYGNVTTTAFDKLGRPTLITYPAYTPPGAPSAITPTESNQYDNNGNLISRTDRRGNTTTFTFDGQNRVVRELDPTVNGVTVQSRVTYDDAGNRKSTTDPNGVVHQFVYDDLNRLTASTLLSTYGGVTTPYTTSYTLDAAGRAIQTCSPAPATALICSTATYSPFGRILTSTNPVGKSSTYTYDALGRLTKTTDPMGHATENVLDPLGRTTQTKQIGDDNSVLATTSYTLDQLGNTTQVNYQGGGQINYTYDPLERLTTVSQLVTTTPLKTITTSYSYDAKDELTRIVDGRNNAWLRTYNPWGLLQDQIEPSTPGQTAITDRRFTTNYDAAGLAVKDTLPGGVIVNRSFDALGQLSLESSVNAANAPSATRSYTYDAAGHVTGIGTTNNQVAVTYDDLGLIRTVSAPTGNSSFQYDEAGRTASRTDAAGTTQYAWDQNSRLAGETDPLTGAVRSYTWNDADQVKRVDYASGGDIRTYTYDHYGRLATDTITNTTGTSTLRSAAYGYDAQSRPTSETVAGTGIAGTGTNTYTYDLAGRLTSWTNPSTTAVAYAWDDTGNRISAGGVTSTFDARNRLLTVGATETNTWTPRGTLLTRTALPANTVTNYTFDGLGRMAAAGTVSYAYDGLDRVVSRTVSGAGTSAFGYSGLETDPVSDGNSLISRSPSGMPVAIKNGAAAAVTVGQDRHGDVVATFDPSGNAATGSKDYTPFGEVASTSGAATGPLGYQADWTDPVTSQVNMGARWYQPSWGDFTSRDNIGVQLRSPISLNLFTYANNDPMSYVDPDGHYGMLAMIDGGGHAQLHSTNYVSAAEKADNKYWNSPAKKAEKAQKKAIDDYVVQQKKKNPKYDPSHDKNLLKVATMIVLQNMSLYDVANKHKDPDQNISEDDFKVVAANADGQYGVMEQWAASLLLGNDTKVSEDQRKAAFSGNGDDLGDYGWKLFAWKKKQPWWKKAITMAVGAIAGTICAVGVTVLTEGAGTVAAGAAAGACGGVASRFTDSMLNGGGFMDSLGDALNPKAMVIDTLIGGFTAGVFEFGGNAVSRILGTGAEALEGEASAVASEELGGTASEEIAAVEEGGGAGVNRGDGRDSLGRFTGEGGYGKSAELDGLSEYSNSTSREVIDDQVRATLPDGSTRYYDGLSPESTEGVYQGVEVKSGSATRTASQRAFDATVNSGVPATARLNGKVIQITSAYLQRI